MVVKYFIKWEGTDKSGKVSGELPLDAKIAEPILQCLVTLKIGKMVLTAVEEEAEDEQKRHHPTNKNSRRRR